MRALIAGLGLIGGSIGLALRARGWHVAYLDPFVDDAGYAADERVTSVVSADVVVLATPVDVAIQQAASGEQRSGVMTSVCSVMTPLRAAAGDNFVAGHPFAGSEKHGLAAARGDLFVGKPWFVDREHPLVTQVVEACGATLEVVDADDHDRAVALTSHLPQLLSTALAAHLDGIDERFVGSGLKTFLRLAESDAGVWAPVFEANAQHVSEHLDAVVRIAREMLRGDAGAFARAQRFVR